MSNSNGFEKLLILIGSVEVLNDCDSADEYHPHRSFPHRWNLKGLARKIDLILIDFDFRQG